MRTSLIFSVIVYATTVMPAPSFSDSISNFFSGQSEKATKFFEEQRQKIERAFNSSIEEATRMKDTVNNYMEEQQNKISTDINNYVESVKESGRKVADSWSYLPNDDSTARLENPDIVLSVPATIARHGYNCETHTVISQGYLLSIHRIPRSKKGDNVPSKTVILHHGLFASSADWILNGPEKGLAYTLADAGYDVWMPNIRGNKYSREHAWLKTDSKSYWNFSWHDVALYDVPAIIDYIIKMKGEGTKITYIGHSMGTTILFAMLTLRPDYNKILTAGFALAPVVFMNDMKSSLKSFAPLASNVAYMEMLYGSHEFIPKHSALGRISTSCKADSFDAAYCRNIIFSICGYNEKQFNKELLPVFLSHLGTGTSWKTTVHFAQLVTSERFQQFDYGASHNKIMYGRETPPEYDLKKVTLPITLFWSKNDLLSSETAVNMLKERLPATTDSYLVPNEEFNHLDYLWAIDAPTLLNNKIIEKLDAVSSSYDFYFSIKAVGK
ncbi:lipase 3-like [Cydia pomonella]|uniref:lipase 3-like n=1 Tax=Cydia pomonella TaxID=82600 RepID=UPI002ADD9ED5|nr:lipase 3-like [Cydia pomonella]